MQQPKKSVVKLNLKCSEEDKQVGQSREEGKQEEERREWVERKETEWGIDKQIIVCKELLCLFSSSFTTTPSTPLTPDKQNF